VVGSQGQPPRVRCGWLGAVPVGRTDNAGCSAGDPVDLIDDDDRVSGGEKLGCDERLSAAVGQQLLEGGHELASTAEVTELLGEIVAKRARKCRGTAELD
jgi:hypothetical protein